MHYCIPYIPATGARWIYHFVFGLAHLSIYLISKMSNCLDVVMLHLVFLVR